MTKTLIIINVLLIAVQQLVKADELGVPVLLWQHREASDGQYLGDNSDGLFDSRSTVHRIDANVLSDDYLNTYDTIVAFVQNRLSLEQFTVEDERRLDTIRNIFTDRSLEPTLLTDVLKPTEALTSKQRFRRESWADISVRTGDRVVIELPDESLAENNILLAELIEKIGQNISKKALYLLTGYQNQYDSADLDAELLAAEGRQRARFTRAAADEPVADEEGQEEIIKNGSLIQVKNCLYFYSTSITIYRNVSKDKDPKIYWDFIGTFEVNETVINGTGRCWELDQYGKTSEVSAFLNLSFKNKNDTELHMNFEILRNDSWYWHIVNNNTLAKVKDKGSSTKIDSYLMPLTEITAEESFSYSCSHLTVYSRMKDDEPIWSLLMIQFENFQLQPFENPANNGTDQRRIIFADSFDCEVWMTLPLWMGLLILLLLIIILFLGIYFISSIKTNDRFENPKGKPLIINDIEE